jgi:hypothetical protein
MLDDRASELGLSPNTIKQIKNSGESVIYVAHNATAKFTVIEK